MTLKDYEGVWWAPLIGAGGGGGGGIGSVGLSLPYIFAVSNSPLTANGAITASFDPAAPLLPANGGTGLTAVGTNSQLLSSNGATLEWIDSPVGVTSVSTLLPLTTSGGATPEISIANFTGTGNVVLAVNPVIDSPTVNTSLALNGPLTGSVPISGSTAGVYAGLQLGFPAIEMVGDGQFKYIDFANILTDYQARIIYDNVAETLQLETGGTFVTLGASSLTVVSATINLTGAVSATSLTLSTPLAVSEGGTGLASVGTNGQFLQSDGVNVSWVSLPPSGISTVTATAPLASSGGSDPVISIASSTGTGGVVLAASPTITAPVIDTSLSLSGPHIGEIAPQNAVAGTYVGVQTTYPCIELCSDNRFKLIDFAALNSDTVGRILYDDFDSSLSFILGASTVLQVSNSLATLAATTISLQGGLTISTTAPNSVVVTDGSNNIVSTPSTGTGGIVRDSGATLTNAALYGNVQLPVNFAWYAGGSPFPTNVLSTYKPPTLFDSSGTIITYDVGTGSFTNNTGGNLMMRVTYSLKRDSNAFGIDEYGILLSTGDRLGKNRVTGADWASGSGVFVLGNLASFSIEIFQNSGDLGRSIDAGAGVQYSYWVL